MNTREKILTAAKDLILKVGYNGFSFHDISEPLQIKNAAVHYYFPGKEDLGRAVIRREHERVKAWKEEVEPLDHWQQLDEFFKIYDNNMKHHRICMMGSVSSDFYTVPESMRESLHAMVIDIKDWLTQLLDSGRDAGIFNFQGTPGDKAAVVVSTLAAGLQLSRVLGEEQFEQIKNQIKLELTPNKNDK